MRLFTWIISKLPIRRTNDEESNLQDLRKEIESLRKENKGLKEKIIVFPQKNDEKIHLEFFDKNIEAVIAENIREAKKELCVAVAWFTSNVLRDELINLKRRGVIIKVIISDEDKNFKYDNINKLINACDELKIADIPKPDNLKYKGLMRNKYCIIDNKKVIDGSYNWSWSNGFGINEEHIIIIENTAVAKMFKNNFDKIFNNPEYYKRSIIHYKSG